MSDTLRAARGAASLVATLVGLSAGSSALAQSYTDPGGYLVIGGISAFESFQNTQGTPIDDSLGFNIRGGYRFLPQLSAELELDFISGFDFEFDLPVAPGRAALTIDGGTLTANAKAHLPLGRIQPFGLVGLGGMWARLRTTHPVGTTCTPYYWYWYCTGTYAELGNNGAFVMKFGGGVDLYLSEDIALTLDAAYVMPFGKLEDLTYTHFGWGARFAF